MPRPKPAAAKAFVRNHTKLQPVPGVQGIRLHLAADVLELWRLAQLATGDPEAPLPYWAFAWAGGLALARYINEQPATVRGKRIFDLGSGSGLVAIAAARAGAEEVTAADIDPFSLAAIELNARANGVRTRLVGTDVLDDEPPQEVDLVLAADVYYEASLAARATRWLARASGAGIDVLIGDPGRRHLPAGQLDELATYEVRTTTELEDLAQKVARVYRLGGQLSSPSVDMS